jgi:hypothetical protein
MKTRRLLFAVVLLLLVGIIGGPVGGSSPALAVVSLVSPATTKLLYAGVVHGAPERVMLLGVVQIDMVVVRDPDFGTPPAVRLSIDFSNVTGIGMQTGTKYVTSGGQELVRPLVATDVVDVTFAIHPSGATGFMRARPVLASFTLNYDLRRGTFVSGTVSPSVNVTDSLRAQ